MSDLLPPPTWPAMAPPTDGRLGSVSVSPVTPVVTGALGTWTLTYIAGRFGVDDGGALRIALHTSSDIGQPQFDNPSSPDYCTVSTSAASPSHPVARYDGDLGVRPWKRLIVVRVRDHAIRPGDTITVVLGDRRGGSPGLRAQTFSGLMRFHFLVDTYATGIFLPVAAPVAVPVVAGVADHLRVHAPSDAAAGTPFRLTVVALDQWGNATTHRREQVHLDRPGIFTVPVRDEATGLAGESNPVLVRAAGETPPHQIVWGDLHAQSEETIGSGTLDDYFTHARDCAAIDFAGHQGNDFQVTGAVWRQIMAKTQEYDAASQFVTFAGYEWSGNTPGGGDHNVHFRGGAGQRFDLHRSGHWQIPDRSDEATDRYPVSELYREFQGRDDVILIPHVGGRYANLREYFDESLMPLVEISSCWGVFEWFAGDALETGRVFGFSAGSDDHTARPGMSHAPRGHFAIGGGLTAVLARDHTREAIWEGIKARRTYATTGARLLLDVVARVGDRTYPVGSEIDLHGDETLEIATKVHGTAPLWRVEVVRWPDVVYRHAFPEPVADPASSGQVRLRLGWSGSRIRARHRMTDWSGQLTVESGRILHVEGWGFDHPENGVTAHDAHAVRWESATAGDWDGIVVDLQVEPGTRLHFKSGPATFSFAPGDVDAEPLVFDAGGVGQRVEVERESLVERPRDAAFVFPVGSVPPATAGAGSPARDAYFVRVTQQDGHIAWSSPFFIRRRDA